MSIAAYPEDQLAGAMVLYTEYNRLAVNKLYNDMLDGDLSDQQASDRFAEIIQLDPAAAFQQQCTAYAMHQGKPLSSDRAVMAQLWKHPHIDAMCCRVAIYREPDGSLEIHAREDRGAFAVFYPGSSPNKKAAALALCKPTKESSLLELSDSGDESVFSGLVPYRKNDATALFGETENHLRGICSCSKDEHRQPPRFNSGTRPQNG